MTITAPIRRKSPGAMVDLPLDFGNLEQHGCFFGSYAVMVPSGGNPQGARAQPAPLLRRRERTLCRVGCEKVVKLMELKVWDAPLLEQLSRAMADASICGLAQAAPNRSARSSNSSP
jgi:formate dehydrogenase beta subunit